MTRKSLFLVVPLLLLTVGLDHAGRRRRSDAGGRDRSKQRITICHIPPGNPDAAHTITIDTSALQAHEDHGDSIGSCSVDGGISCTRAVLDQEANPPTIRIEGSFDFDFCDDPAVFMATVGGSNPD